MKARPVIVMVTLCAGFHPVGEFAGSKASAADIFAACGTQEQDLRFPAFFLRDGILTEGEVQVQVGKGRKSKLVFLQKVPYSQNHCYQRPYNEA